MEVQRIYVGGWFQRTRLHLSEIYDFLRGEASPLALEKDKLTRLRNKLNIEHAELQLGPIDHIEIASDTGVAVSLYEDGLILLRKDYEDIKGDVQALTRYYEKPLSNAIKYLFSLGAPIPKELADIKNVFPYFVVLKNANDEDIQSLLDEFGQKEYFEAESETFKIYRGDKLYIIDNKGEDLETLELFIQEQIFSREFNAQLHRYLNIHRIIWEKIADVKERGKIRGSDIALFRTKIERYNKTINLIETRINQMGIYLNTRSRIVSENKKLQDIAELLQFRHERLENTLQYIKEIWAMTKNYVDSAIKLFTELQEQSTVKSIDNLTIVTSIGVGGTIIGIFAAPAIPNITTIGIMYVGGLAVLGYAVNATLKYIAKSRHYEIKDTEIDTHI